MIAQVQFGSTNYQIDFSKPIDLSIPIRHEGATISAFHIPQARFEPITVGSFTGSVAAGAGCNCENLTLNAHGNGTHTECLGHISLERVTLYDCLQEFHFLAQLVTVTPEPRTDGDFTIRKSALEEALIKHPFEEAPKAILIRTLPNDDSKHIKHYSGQNPVYLEPDAVDFLVEQGFDHLLIDLPSVDREEDGGALEAHHRWWRFPEAPRFHATISELIYVPNEVSDGHYLLNLQIASLTTDASPSKPCLYPLSSTK
jgi:arylformamidase